MPEAFVGRQPIYDRNLEVYGYELLFRRGAEERADVRDGDAATARVILSAFQEIGMRDVAAGRRAFVNLTRAFIVGDLELPLPTEGVVLEVLEDIQPDREVLEGLRALSARGFTIALDDFVLDAKTEAFLDFASIIKIDIVDLGPEAVERQVERLRRRGLTLLAEQVRTQEDFARCRDLGFDLYQGYFLSRPYVVRGRRMNPSRLAVLRELSRWLAPGADLDAELGAIPGLGARLESLGTPGESRGDEELRNLGASWALSRTADRPRALVVSALLRARMCELLARALGRANFHEFFTTGLLSTLGALLECSLTRVVEELPLPPDVRIALLSESGELGAALACVLAYERSDWERIGLAGLGEADIRDAFVHAVAWAERAADVLLAPARG